MKIKSVLTVILIMVVLFITAAFVGEVAQNRLVALAMGMLVATSIMQAFHPIGFGEVYTNRRSLVKAFKKWDIEYKKNPSSHQSTPEESADYLIELLKE